MSAHLNRQQRSAGVQQMIQQFVSVVLLSPKIRGLIFVKEDGMFEKLNKIPHADGVTTRGGRVPRCVV